MKHLKKLLAIIISLAILTCTIPATFAETAVDGTVTDATNGTVTDDGTVEPDVEPYLTQIAVREMPSKMTYYVGEEFDPTGIVLIGWYQTDENSATTTQVITSGFEVLGFDSSIPGAYELTVAYGGITCGGIWIEIQEKTDTEIPADKVIGRITVNVLPNKTTYAVGEALDTTGMVLRVWYTDGSVANFTEGFNCSEIDATVMGTQTITVEYAGFETTFEITVEKTLEGGGDVVAPIIQDATIINQPTKTVYTVGEELDTSGIEIALNWSDGSTTVATSDMFYADGFDPYAEGTQFVSIYIYGTDIRLEYNVLVEKNESGGGNETNPSEGKEDAYITEIAILTEPTKTEYYVGETLVTAGLQIEVYYSDGSSEVLKQGFDIDGFNSSEAGECTVTINYDGYEAYFEVYINELPLDKANLTVENKSVSVNAETVEISFALTSESDITNLGIRNITFDESSFEFVSGVWTLPVEPTFSEDYVVGSPAGAVYDDPVNCNGEIFTLTLRILDDASACTTEIGCDFTAKNGDEEIETMVVNGIIELTEAMRGDINGDGSRNNKDVVYLLNYILFPQSFPLLEEGDMNLDYNGDGRISTKDVSYLLNNINWGDSDYPLN